MPSASPSPRLWTIPPSAAFLDTLADCLLDGRLVPGTHDLADYRVLLPTRRACRALTGLLAARAGKDAILLPRIRAIGDVDEAELAFRAAEGLGTSEDALALSPALDPLRRQLLLTDLVLTWGRTVARTLMVPGRNEPVAIPVRPADAALLARDLARLMDDFETEAQPFSALADLVPEEHAEYWRLTLAFLRIATEQWPMILEHESAIDPAARRDALLRAEAARLTRDAPGHPVVAAGSTGTIPATGELLAAISRLPYGAVILPGLDNGLDDASWSAIDASSKPHPAHPQYGLKKLLGRIDASREMVKPLAAPIRPSRERLVSEAMRPPETTDAWAGLAERLDDDKRRSALTGMAIIEADNELEEALSIALMLRETAEAPDRTAALITPDRGLARRVSSELARWGLNLDDSAGTPLADTPAGVVLRLIADAAAGRLAPASLVALLQHPLATFGQPPGEARQAARTLELLALRGPRPAPGTDGLLRVVRQAAEDLDDGRQHPVLARLTSTQRNAALALAEQIAETFGPFEARPHGAEWALSDLLAAHDAAIRRIARRPDGSCGAFEGLAGEALEAFLEDASTAAGGGLSLVLDDYPALLGVLMTGQTVRAQGHDHPRLSILGPLEARLLSADRVILASLNEASWPAEVRTDAFLNRAMRASVGLEAPERFIGLAAHDVAQFMAAPEVMLTRAARAGGEPTVASRWLQRLSAVAGREQTNAMSERGRRYLDWARQLDHATDRDLPSEPFPRPAVEHRPARLSVTEIETLIRDPYAVYARRVLELEPLDELDAAPDAATRGSLIHEAMRDFDAALAAGPLDDPVARLIDIGKAHFAAVAAFPELHAVWWPRFCRIATWFAPIDATERALLADRKTEVRSRLDLDIAGRPFQLVGRADRIDIRADRALRIVDYKTGSAPTGPQVESGLSPQLPLEAAMAREGAFEGIDPGSPIAGLTYIILRGGSPPGAICDIAPKTLGQNELADETLANVKRLLTRFADPSTAYRAKTHVQHQRFATAYDHLSRYAEWSVANGTEG